MIVTETAIKDGVAYEGDLDLEPIQVSEANERHAEDFEKRCHERATVQFQRLKDEARAIFGMMEGQPGIRSLAKLQELLEKAGDEIGNGRFYSRISLTIEDTFQHHLEFRQSRILIIAGNGAPGLEPLAVGAECTDPSLCAV